MMKTNTEVYASFAVVLLEGGTKIWGTTRDGRDTGKIGLPGGKVDPGETPVDAARREAAEEGLIVSGPGVLINRAPYRGKTIEWYLFDGATELVDYKERYRGIRPVVISTEEIAAYGFGNEFILNFVDVE